MRPTRSPDDSDGAARGAGPERRRGTWLLVLAAALLGLVQLLVLAPWMGEDEPWQLEYASHVAAGYRPWGGEPMRGPPLYEVDDRMLMPLSQLQARRRFHAIPAERLAGTQQAILDSMEAHDFYVKVDWAGVEPRRGDFDQVAPTFSAVTQPPLYYGLAGGVMAALGVDSAEGQMWVGRGLSWVLYVLTVLVALALGRCAFDDERAALTVGAIVAFLPMSARQAAVVNNDVLAKLLAGLVLLIAARWVRDRARRWEPPLAFVLCALGLLSKPTAAGAAVVLLVALAMRSKRVARRGRTLAAGAALVLLVGAVVAVWLTQNSTVLPRSLVGLRTRLQGGLSTDALVMLARSFVGGLGWESRFLPDLLVGVVVSGFGAALVAAATALWRNVPVASRPVLLLCLVAVVVQLAMLVLRGAARGRYFMPALPALAVVTVAGAAWAWPQAARSRAATVLVLALIALEAGFLWGGLMLHEVLRWGV